MIGQLSLESFRLVERLINQYSFILFFLFRYETSNGISASENGVSIPGNEPESVNYVRSGSYSYTWDGVPYIVTWMADENGYRPQGDHLP